MDHLPYWEYQILVDDWIEQIKQDEAEQKRQEAEQKRQHAEQERKSRSTYKPPSFKPPK